MKDVVKLFQAVSKTSERRQALNEYQSSTPANEIKADRIAELSKALNEAENDLRAECKRLQDAEAAEVTEHRDLVSRISARNYVERALNDRAVTGAEAEYNKELGLDDRNTAPFAALLPTDEERADVATPVADAAIQHPQAAPVLRRVFRDTRVSFFGARMPSVASGEPVFPVMLQTNAPGGFPVTNDVADPIAGPVSAMAAGDTIESVAAAFSGFMVSPKRISGRYTWRMEDTAKLPIESILRADLREMMGWQLDFQVLNGGLSLDAVADVNAINPNYFAAASTGDAWRGFDASNARNFDGIRKSIPLPTGDGDSSINLVFDEGLKIVATGIDGLFANTYSDLRVLLGTDTYKRMTQVFQEDSARSLWEYLQAIGVNMEASGIIPDTGEAADAGEHPAHGTEKKQEAVMTSRGSDLVVPVWEGITMIRDPYTGAAKGETALTAHMLANMQFLRKDAWKRLHFQLKA